MGANNCCYGCPLVHDSLACYLAPHPCWLDPRWREFGYDELEYEQATVNRRIIREELFTEAWEYIEQALTGIPMFEPMPKQIPVADDTSYQCEYGKLIKWKGEAK